VTHDPHDHPTRATLRALDQQRADTLADALRPVAAPPALDLDAIEAAARADAPRCATCGDVATRRSSCGATWCDLHNTATDAPQCDCAVTPIATDVRVALVAEVRRLRAELYGARHALAEASRGRAAASLRAADAERAHAALLVEHVDAVNTLADTVLDLERRGDEAMAAGLAECERLRRYTVQLKASCRAAAVDAEQSGRTNARSQQEVGRLRGVLYVLNTAAAADAHRSSAAALELAKLRAEERDAATAECARLRAIVEGRTTPPTDVEITAHWRSGGAWLFACRVIRDAAEARLYAAQHAVPWLTMPWVALDGDGRPCAWPVVNDGDVVSDSARRGGD
jgi:hypothetical protein